MSMVENLERNLSDEENRKESGFQPVTTSSVDTENPNHMVEHLTQGTHWISVPEPNANSFGLLQQRLPSPSLFCTGQKNSPLSQQMKLPSMADKQSNRRSRHFVPTNRKDEYYWVKRKKNNEAARKSREKRRINDIMLEQKVLQLVQENLKLKKDLLAVKVKYNEIDEDEMREIEKQMEEQESYSQFSSYNRDDDPIPELMKSSVEKATALYTEEEFNLKFPEGSTLSHDASVPIFYTSSASLCQSKVISCTTHDSVSSVIVKDELSGSVDAPFPVQGIDTGVKSVTRCEPANPRSMCITSAVPPQPHSPHKNPNCLAYIPPTLVVNAHDYQPYSQASLMGQNPASLPSKNHLPFVVTNSTTSSANQKPVNVSVMPVQNFYWMNQRDKEFQTKSTFDDSKPATASRKSEIQSESKLAEEAAFALACLGQRKRPNPDPSNDEVFTRRKVSGHCDVTVQDDGPKTTGENRKTDHSFATAHFHGFVAEDVEGIRAAAHPSPTSDSFPYRIQYEPRKSSIDTSSNESTELYSTSSLSPASTLTSEDSPDEKPLRLPYKLRFKMASSGTT